MKLYVDIETYSSVDLEEHGTPRYAAAEHSGLLCLQYACDNGPLNLLGYYDCIELKSRVYTRPAVLAFLSAWEAADTVVAHNAEFEIWWLIIVCALSHKRWLDTMVKCAYYGYPRALGFAVKALGCKHQKDGQGKSLIDLLSKGGYYTPEDKPEEFERMYRYCGDDVLAMREADGLLPELPAGIQERWETDLQANLRGVPVDLRMIQNAIGLRAHFSAAADMQMASLTSGAVQSIGQGEKLKAWLKQRNVPMSDCQADTVTRTLATVNLLPVERQALELRQASALSSLAKYEKMADYQLDGRLHLMSDFFGCHTMRPSGRGPQVLNLPRSEDPELWADMISNAPSLTFQLSEPMEKLKEGLRGSLCADSQHVFIGYDLAQIEARAGAWAARDYEFLALFENSDPYCTRGKKLFGKELNKKDHPTERNASKANVLSLIFAGGIGAHGRAAQTYKFDLQILADIILPTATPAELFEAEKRWIWYIEKNPPKPMTHAQGLACDVAKQRFRKDYPRIAAYWNELENAFLYGGWAGRVHFEVRGSGLRVMTLPSGRQMFYHGVYQAEDGRYCYQGRRGRYWIWRGVLMENVAQCINADVSDWFKVRVNQIAPVVHHCYDEATMEVEKSRADEVMALVKHLTQNEKPEWADGLPLGFDYWMGRRYGK